MQLDIAQAIVESLEEHGFDASVYNDYSGRNMMGATTTGVSTDARMSEIVLCVIHCAHKFVEVDTYDLDDLAEDQLGRGNIIY